MLSWMTLNIILNSMKKPHQGNLLKKLVKIDHADKSQGYWATRMGYTETHHSRLFKYEELPKNAKYKACRVFNVKPEYFHTPGEKPLEGEISNIKARLSRLEKLVGIMSGQYTDLFDMYKQALDLIRERTSHK